jgi:hypothetical protein
MQVAQSILRTEHVILQSSAILVTRPIAEGERVPRGPGGLLPPLWTEDSEHVDIQYTLEEIDGVRRAATGGKVIFMRPCIIFISDAPYKRVYTYGGGGG